MKQAAHFMVAGFSQEPILNSLGGRILISDNYITIGGIVINCIGD